MTRYENPKIFGLIWDKETKVCLHKSGLYKRLPSATRLNLFPFINNPCASSLSLAVIDVMHKRNLKGMFKRCSIIYPPIYYKCPTLDVTSGLWSLWRSRVAALQSSFLAAMWSAGSRTRPLVSFSSSTATTLSWPCCNATANGVKPSCKWIGKKIKET